VPNVLVVSDAPWVHDEIRSSLPGGDTVLRSLTSGQAVRDAVDEQRPDLAILDMQMGDMGAIAVTYDLHLEESGGRLPNVPVLLLLDRQADTFMARQCKANGWLVKPLDPIRVRKAMKAILDGGTYEDRIVASNDASTNFRPTADSTAR
jgi:CheY-like chemotaxis protein